MGYQLGLPDALRRFGLKVELVDGWETRGNASFNPRGSVNHHTAGGPKGVRPSLAVCVNGRGGTSPLKGPLCNTFLDRNGVAIVVAAGRANHAGTGGFAGLIGNSAVFGTEAESTGNGKDWTPAQIEAYPRIIAAYHWLMKQKNASTNCNHSTWTSRKIDCAGISDGWFRERANALLAQGGAEEDDMYTEDDRNRASRDSSVLWNVLDQLGGVYDEKTGAIDWSRQISKVNPQDGGFRPIDYITWGDQYANNGAKTDTKVLELLTSLTKSVADLKTEVAALKQK